MCRRCPSGMLHVPMAAQPRFGRRVALPTCAVVCHVLLRFEVPFNIWCDQCGEHIAKGVRFNADKKQVTGWCDSCMSAAAIRAPVASPAMTVAHHELLCQQPPTRPK
eukprot:GHUV01026412.1.p2 GENE.GHUV01026412.1~~GHUV01026412.1.p2  ORF type:complete len:107 (+),score=26.09 GHUV01026412.1:52-372(+)